jgi:hypothetical protein
MIRLLAGSALAVLTVGLAGSFVGPSLFGVPRGEPILVAGPGSASLLQTANFEATACAARMLLAENAAADGAESPAVRIVALALRAGPRGLRLAIQELAAEAALPDGTLVLALAADGRVVGMWDAADLKPGAAARALAAGCDGLERDASVAGSI